MGTVKFGFLDYSKERSGFTLNTPAITGANLADYTNDPGGYIDAVVDALAPIVLGTRTHAQFTVLRRVIGTALPVNKSAQRESKALVGIHDSLTGKAFTFTIPTINDDFLANNTDYFDLGTTEWTNLVNALEAAYVTPDGNLLVVDYAKRVGRNI